MHQRNIVHRDLKPANILLESEDVNCMSIKITDFGFSSFFDPSSQGLSLTLGSPFYMAPELLQD
jgi:serine/threonine protein kinase